MRTSIAVANKLLAIAESKGDTLTPLKLIKLVYLCHAWMLGIHGRHLLREPVEAWAFGPCVRELYRLVKDFRSGPVPSPLEVLNAEASFLDDKEKSLISDVYDKYAGFSGPQLSTLTHDAEGPWALTWAKYGRNSVISNDLIEEHYRRLTRPTAPQLVQPNQQAKTVS